MNKMSKKTKLRRTKLRGEAARLAGKLIAEEVRTGKYPRAQAVAIGISRARAELAGRRRASRISAIMERYR